MSRKKRVAIRELASQVGIEVDEVLLTLWDAGIDEVTGPGDYLPPKSANRARRALGIATRRERASPEYWQKRLALTGEELDSLLRELGIKLRHGTAKLPKGAIARLTAEANRHERLKPPTQEGRETPQPLSEQPLEWRTVGHFRELRWLTEDEVLEIHYTLVDDFAAGNDPIDPPGPRSEQLLASAVFRPQTSLGDQLKYPTVEMSAAGLFHALTLDHPFHNGNKRTALVSTLVFLDENALLLTCDQNELFKLVLQTAQHRVVDARLSNLADRECLAIAEWICTKSRLFEKGDRPIPFRRLRQLLTGYRCEFDHPSGGGNRINISRQIIETGFLGLKKKRTLRTQVNHGGEGREVQKNTVHKIRVDLHLDDLHGIDSRAFYEKDRTPTGDFIVKYRKTLRRLAKL